MQGTSDAALGRDLDRFYDLLRELRLRLGGARRLHACHGRMAWPVRGVYFFFEPGEARARGGPRVVRVGTHALRAGSRTTLWGRLRQHRGTTWRDGRPGGGNHRCSIFRQHVGLALLADERRFGDPVRATWSRTRVPREARPAEAELERAVSGHIGPMPFLWLPVDDAPGPTSERGRLEAALIGLLAAARHRDPPSPGWLGLRAGPSIRRSGLWNVIQGEPSYDAAALDLLERRILALPPARS